MRKIFITVVLLFILFNGPLLGQTDSIVQTDSIKYEPAAGLPDRIFLSYPDFRAAQGINREEVEWKGDKTQLEFFTKLLLNETFSYNKGSEPVTIESRKVWGYTQNNWLYLNYKNEFYRVPVFGAISYMVANVMVNVPGYYDPRFGYTTGSSSTTEVREFIMSFYDGKLRDLSVKEAVELFKPDQLLSEEFGKLRKSAQKNELYRYIRRYNAGHPVYFRRE